MLVGDAAHTAHYSVGSGTRLAMEDAIALVGAIERNSDMRSALEDYDRGRRPDVESLQRAARLSEQWWESLPERLRIPPEALLVSYMTRTGRVGLDRLETPAPESVRAVLIRYAGDAPPADDSAALVDWVLDPPFRKGRIRTTRRVVTHDDIGSYSLTPVEFGLTSAWNPEADSLLHELAGHDLALEIVILSGPNSSEALMTRMHFAERVEIAFPRAVVAVVADEAADPAVAAGLMTGRLDLVIRSDDAGSATPEVGLAART